MDNYASAVSAQNTASQAGRTAPPAANLTCFGTIENAASEIAGTANMVEAMVDRLCGAEPRPADTGAKEIRGLPSGVFDAAMTHGQQVYESAQRIRRALQRLEQRLP